MNRRLAITVLLAACGGKSANECRTEAESLATLLRETPHEMSPLMPQQDVTLVKRSDLRDAGTWKAIVVVATAERTTSQGSPIGGAGDLRDLLELRRNGGATKDYGVYFQLDRATPWSKVVELVDAKRVGHTQIGFAFATGDKLTPPPRTPIDDKLDALMSGPANNRAVELARLIETTITDCPALTEEFGKVGESTESKADIIIKGLAPALVECKCDVDMPALRSVMWRLMAVEPNLKVLAFDATSGAKLAFPAATTWEVASKRLSPGTNYQLAVE